MNYYIRINPLNINEVYIGRTSKHILGRNHRDWASFYDGKLSKNLMAVYSELEKNKLDFAVLLLEASDNSENFDVREQEWIDKYRATGHTMLNANCVSNNNKYMSQKVSCYNLDGTFVKTFDSKLQACLLLKINPTNLNKALSGKLKKTAGYMWAYEKHEFVDPIDTRLRTKRVGCYTKQGDFVGEYPSMSEAARAVGLKSDASIIYAISGKCKTAKGFIWKIIT